MCTRRPPPSRAPACLPCAQVLQTNKAGAETDPNITALTDAVKHAAQWTKDSQAAVAAEIGSTIKQGDPKVGAGSAGRWWRPGGVGGAGALGGQHAGAACSSAGATWGQRSSAYRCAAPFATQRPTATTTTATTTTSPPLPPLPLAPQVSKRVMDIATELAGADKAGKAKAADAEAAAAAAQQEAAAVTGPVVKVLPGGELEQQDDSAVGPVVKLGGWPGADTCVRTTGCLACAT